MRITVAFLLAALAACSTSSDSKKTARSGPPEPPGAAVAAGKNPLSKYLEVMGFRMTEQGEGKLKITFAVVNHSDADIGDLALKIKLMTTAEKPEDPPVADFEAKVGSLAPRENKDVTVSVPTKMRIYELPDWQFMRAQFEVTSPAPEQ